MMEVERHVGQFWAIQHQQMLLECLGQDLSNHTGRNEERERETDRQRDRQRETERQTERQREEKEVVDEIEVLLSKQHMLNN